MIRKYIDLIIGLLPIEIQNLLITTLNKCLRKLIVANWEKQGKPVPPPHAIKQLAIEYFQKQYQCTTLVETGTYLGNMVLIQKNYFSKIYSIELDENLWRNAVKRFSKYKHIEILQGDSGKVLNNIVPKLSSKAIFWLDGHYSAGLTAKGDKECPIYEELNAIFRGIKFNHILVIDDARCFVGKGDYPTIFELETYVKSKNPNYQLEVKDDIIRIFVP